jgi:4-amino-4-deoxy-L-arabinose transferase-like glycosyltransferase
LFLLAALALFAYGISWGLPSARGWAGDEILPGVVAAGLRRGFAGGWHTKYPPLHYYLLALLHAPVRALADSGLSWHELNHRLMLAGRWLSVAMALGTVWAVYRAGREVTGRRGALLAAVIVALMPPFVYFAKTANVEMPMLFWLALSLWLFLRVLRRHRTRDWLLLSITAALAVATKDQAYGFYVLAPLALLPSLARHRRAEGLPGGVRTLLDRRAWLAVAAGVLAFALAFNLAANRRGFEKHVRTLTGADAAAGEAQEYTPNLHGQLQTLHQNVRHLAFCLGWPFFLVSLVGLADAIRRRREAASRRLLALQALGLSYYFTFLAVILFSRDRYTLPLALPLALCAGHFLDRLLGSRRLRLATAAGLALVLAWSALRALAVDLRMVNDSRYAAEAWLTAHGAPPRTALAIGRPRHVPRIAFMDWRRVLRTDGQALARRRPHYVVVNVTDLRAPKERLLYARLLSGDQGYRPAARFHWTSPWDFLDTRGSLTTLDLINPRLAVFEKRTLPPT